MAIIDWSWTFSDWILLSIFALTALYYYATSTYDHFSRQSVPHDKPLPFLGNMTCALIKHQPFPLYLLDMYNKFKYRQYCGFYLFKLPVVLLRDPELVKTITVKDFEYFTDHQTALPDEAVPEWTKGLFSLRGQRWKEMRSILDPAFTSTKMKTMSILISDCCQQLVNFLQQCQHDIPQTYCNITEDDNMLILELKDIFTRYTNDVIASTTFGIKMDSLTHSKNEFFRLGQEATNFTGYSRLKWLGFTISPKLMQILGINLIPHRVTNFFKSLILETINTREKRGIEGSDLIQILMHAKKDALQEGNKIKLEDEDILAQVLSCLVAGFETTPTLLSFTCYLLATHTVKQTKLQEEIDAVFWENGGNFSYETLSSLNYLDMVVSETLRLYPPVAGVDRICVKPYILQADPPLQIYPGESLHIPFFALHRDPQYFPEPESFIPERFSEENKHNIDPLTYLPFGIGPRSCIGNHFALMGVKLALVHLLSKFNMKMVDKTPDPIKIVQNRFSISIDGGLWIGFKPRNS